MQAREADLKTDRQSAAIHDITTDLENVRAAWQWAINGHDIDQIDATLDALWLYCLVCGAVLVGDALFGLAAARLERTPQAHVTLGRVLARQAEFRVSASHSRRELANRSLDLVAGLPQEEAQVAWAMVFNDKDWLAGEAERLRVYLQGGIDYWRVQGDRWKEAMAFFELGEFCYDRYEYAEARRQYEQGLALGRSVGEHFIQGLCLSSIAIVTTDLAENEQYNRDALRHYEALGNRFKVGLVLNNLALVRADIGDLPEAERLIQQALEIGKDTGANMGMILDSLGTIKYLAEDYEEAQQIYEQCLTLFDQQSNSFLVSGEHLQLAFVAIATRQMAEARRHLVTSLQYAVEHDNILRMADGLVGYAAILVAQHQLEQALDLLALATHYPDFDRHTHDEARLLAHLEAELGQEVVAAAILRAEAQDLAAVTRAVLADLEDES